MRCLSAQGVTAAQVEQLRVSMEPRAHSGGVCNAAQPRGGPPTLAPRPIRLAVRGVARLGASAWVFYDGLNGLTGSMESNQTGSGQNTGVYCSSHGCVWEFIVIMYLFTCLGFSINSKPCQVTATHL